jgi:hypothetical protein
LLPGVGLGVAVGVPLDVLPLELPPQPIAINKQMPGTNQRNLFTAGKLLGVDSAS